MPKDYSHLELAYIQARTLFLQNAGGRMLGVNEPEPDELAPRFFLSRTRDGNLWRMRYDLPEDLTEELDSLASIEPRLGEHGRPPVNLARYTELLLSQEQVTETNHGPAYLLPPLVPSTGTTTITVANRHLLLSNFPYTHSMFEERSPVVVVVDGDAAVSACYSVRSSDLAVEAGVDTIADYRGRGYAVQVVSGWATAVRASGRLPPYSTSWVNRASQTVARKLGAVLYADNFHIA